MINGLYKSGRTAISTGNIKWKPKYGDTIKCLMVTRQYTPDLKTHSSLSNIPIESRVCIDGKKVKQYAPRLALSQPDDGVFDAQDVIFDGVPNGKEIKGVVIFKDGIEDTDTTLLAYIGVDFISNGTQIIITWDNGPSKIFRI